MAKRASRRRVWVGGGSGPPIIDHSTYYALITVNDSKARHADRWWIKYLL